MDKILDAIIDRLNQQESIDDERAEIIRYGLELLLMKITFSASVLIIGAFMGSFWECLIFMIFYTGIRSKAGGYHADTRLRCFIQSLLSFVFVLAIIKLEGAYPVVIFPLAILTALSFGVIYKLAPMDTENKRLDDSERVIFRRKTLLYLAAEVIIAVITYFTGFDGISCAAMLAVMMTGILLLAALKNNGGNVCDSGNE